MAETEGQIRVRLVTPERILVEAEATAVEVPSKSGYLEVLYGHAPLLAELDAGHVRLHGGSADGLEFFVGAWGFCEVLPDQVTILASSAVKPEELNAQAAEQELERGQKLWNEAGEDAQKYARANEVIHEAEVTLAAVQGSRF
ncbi:MAG TPA: ATP synthase F1 subunit epsilon [Acidobacteriaceae bacterium]|jgi:F-type H+-transporting ATPase subunit epsilon|nr:ATP synthase F1 subunit epsilon [Acidobacteriaceae bacterium]